MIKKIKIDVFLDRPADSIMSTNYLKMFKSNWGFGIRPKHINNNHLILSTLLAEKANYDDMESLKFYDATSIRKIIDVQQPLALKIDWWLKYVYLTTFVLPFCVNVYHNQIEYPNRFLRGVKQNEDIALVSIVISAIS